VNKLQIFKYFFAPMDDKLLVVTKPLSNIQNPAAINATKTPPISKAKELKFGLSLLLQ
jgi:hypothetical protein